MKTGEISQNSCDVISRAYFSRFESLRQTSEERFEEEVENRRKASQAAAQPEKIVLKEVPR